MFVTIVGVWRGDMEASIASFIDYLRYERGASAATRVAYENDLLQFVAYVHEHTENGKASLGFVDSDFFGEGKPDLWLDGWGQTK